MSDSAFIERQLSIRDHIYEKSSESIFVIEFSSTAQSSDSYHRSSVHPCIRIREFSSFAMHAQPASYHGRSPRYNCLLKKNSLSTESPWKTATIQLLGCAWRCWYCYVDPVNLKHTSPHARKIRIADLCIEACSVSEGILDLSGGQPDLVPEWPLYFNKQIMAIQGASRLHIRSEDNLCNDFLWRFLSAKEVGELARSPLYTRIGCFKGFDSESFGDVVGNGFKFDDQLTCAARLIRDGFDPFYYATFSPSSAERLEARIRIFFEQLLGISDSLPLRVIPLLLRRTENWKPRRGVTFERKAEYNDMANQVWFALIQENFGKGAFGTELRELP
jgi:uncharacterized Fe-S cluster-containing radical SAM superfamily protein